MTDSIDRVLIATLILGLALVILVDIGAAGAIAIGAAVTPIVLLLLQRRG